MLFIIRQPWLQRTDAALLDLRTFRAPTFSYSIVMIAISMLTLLGAVQQLGGAAGTALFVTVMTAGTTTLLSSGASVLAAFATGIHSAFIYGAIISVLAIPVSFFIRKPAHTTDSFSTAH